MLLFPHSLTILIPSFQIPLWYLFHPYKKKLHSSHGILDHLYPTKYIIKHKSRKTHGYNNKETQFSKLPIVPGLCKKLNLPHQIYKKSWAYIHIYKLNILHRWTIAQCWCCFHSIMSKIMNHQRYLCSLVNICKIKQKKVK